MRDSRHDKFFINAGILLLFLLILSIGLFAVPAQSDGQSSVCRESIISLFDLTNETTVDLGENSHPEIKGCKGWASEKYTIEKPTVSLNHNIITVIYRSDRYRVRGYCPGSKWGPSVDSPRYLDGKALIHFKVSQGILAITSIEDKRIPESDTRPSWVFDHLKGRLEKRTDTFVDCSDTN